MPTDDSDEMEPALVALIDVLRREGAINWDGIRVLARLRDRGYDIVYVGPQEDFDAD